MEKIIIIAAPSGSGKTTIVKRLLQDCDALSFSISAATRQARQNELNGRDYYFISVEAFQKHIDAGDFLEWEMVYEGKYYGTLLSEIDRIYAAAKFPILDIDVVGAANLKAKYQDKVLAIFIKAPTVNVLASRLKARNTDPESVILERLAKAQYEMGFESKFDYTVINDDLSKAIDEVKAIISREISIA